MAELPYMKLFPGDYLMDTRHLTLEEHGAYLMLMMEYWTSGKALLDSDQRFSRTLGVSLQKWRALRPTLEEFFICDGTTWMHKRIELDMKNTRLRVEQARKAGRASANARSNGRSTGVQRKSNGRSGTRSTEEPTKKQPYHSHSNNPLTPLRSDSAPAPSLKGRGRAQSSEGKSIGDIIGSAGKQEKRK